MRGSKPPYLRQAHTVRRAESDGAAPCPDHAAHDRLVPPHDPDNTPDNDLFRLCDIQPKIWIGFFVGVLGFENKFICLAINSNTLDHHSFIRDARRVEFVSYRWPVFFDSNYRAVRNERFHAVPVYEDGKVSLAQIIGGRIHGKKRGEFGNVDGRTSPGNVIDGKLLQISLDFLRRGMA